MNYKSDMLRIKRYSHSLRIVMNVFYWAAIIVAIGSLITALVITFMSDSHFVLNDEKIGNIGFTVDGLIEYNLKDASLMGLSLKNVYTSIAIMAAVISFLTIPALKQLVLILKSVEENKPFAKENSKRISIIGVVFIFGSFIIPAAEFFVARTIVDTLKIQNVSVNYTGNFILVFAGILMIILSGIFKYGSYLQHEYDETV
ncbi:hypothetical protein CDQ84_01840 [Clostridium thermosuccinogenes]|uniref:DUF2975 domain-containing protein n=1 Tax=Clostridium thermosuccinogenes TaxID=84032 RepID=A0A2K2FLR1_9CLOT|nr:DUF2975 domain-containing protein [Pseudoclostridium thermosuccinogenes]AUS96878.1 hypothetical protein CDO33_10760 [Pseudoclostridium thermosuccinogenes]PNT92456.1 hypothetical protein CDQ83_02485 [Pseudoclostridium thermosuccinogenes]PNT99705.1 hypothetical protein CDQ85_02495 [Pseudoclostridium thermosuccinogenes]PNU01161.1 hypothetical protein CDQ84_01840 [Pseudoclostridium thermosuccinogenes]